MKEPPDSIKADPELYALVLKAKEIITQDPVPDFIEIQERFHKNVSQSMETQFNVKQNLAKLKALLTAISDNKKKQKGKDD